MGLSRLILVRPPKDDSGEAMKLAAGAGPIIASALRVPTLPEAIAGHGLVIGASRHRGRLRRNVGTPRETAERLLPLLPSNRVAILFGREVNGLDRKELALCSEILSIPSAPDFPSLNLSHAVMVAAYELFVAAQVHYPSAERALAPAADLERFFGHLQRTLQDIGFLEEEHPERIMATLRQVFGRARLDPRDLRMLRGILTSVDRARRQDQP
jgi:tRNA (cytidine32/uridine32-2'-O)-methyltransferase